MKVYAATDCGSEKSKNEDRILIDSSIIATGSYFCNMDYGVVAIADGVGGRNAGSVASQYVCSRLSVDPFVNEENFKSINKELIALGQKRDEWQGLATTLTGMAFLGARAAIFHVGNTRVYKIQAGSYLKQMTVDDTTVNYLVQTGKLTEEDAETYDARNEITACFGGSNEKLLQMTIKNLRVESFDSYLLTSDGIHEKLSQDDMEDILMDSNGAMDFCKSLISAARVNGSVDDCTAVLIDLDEINNGDEIINGEEINNGLEISQEY